MPRPRQSSANRQDRAGSPHTLLTEAEARGEAAYLVMKLVLEQLPHHMRKRILLRACIEADQAGVAAVTEEVEGLFHDFRFEAPAR